MSSSAATELERVPRRRAMPRDIPAPPAELAPDTFAGRLYDMLEPLAEQDPVAGWSLLILCNAIGTGYQLVEDLVRDTPDGPGWSALMDADRCPYEALPWLAQFAGVRIPAGLVDDADRRAWVESTDGFNRGTRDALIGAAKATLTGAQRLVFRERDGAAHGYPAAPEVAYVLTVYSYATETPDPTATLNALLAQKPGGIVLYYSAATMQDYQNVKDTNATYAVVKSTFKDYAALAMNQPG
jgi:hypothetical protein